MAARLAGRKIAGVKRYGKFIVMSIRGGGYLTIHLGMTGKLLLGRRSRQAYARDPDARPRRPAVRRQPAVRPAAVQRGVSGAHRQSSVRSRSRSSFEDFAGGLKRRKTRIKALLLNQDFLRGIGNIYADEALFRAGIHPLALASRIRGDRARRLYDAHRRGAFGGYRGRRVVYLGLCRCGGAQGFFSVQPSGLSAHRRAVCDLRRADPPRFSGAALISLLSEMPEALDWILLKPKCMATVVELNSCRSVQAPINQAIAILEELGDF